MDWSHQTNSPSHLHYFLALKKKNTYIDIPSPVVPFSFLLLHHRIICRPFFSLSLCPAFFSFRQGFFGGIGYHISDGEKEKNGRDHLFQIYSLAKIMINILLCPMASLLIPPFSTIIFYKEFWLAQHHIHLLMFAAFLEIHPVFGCCQDGRKDRAEMEVGEIVSQVTTSSDGTSHTEPDWLQNGAKKCQ